MTLLMKLLCSYISDETISVSMDIGTLAFIATEVMCHIKLDFILERKHKRKCPHSTV